MCERCFLLHIQATEFLFLDLNTSGGNKYPDLLDNPEGISKKNTLSIFQISIWSLLSRVVDEVEIQLIYL